VYSANTNDKLLTYSRDSIRDMPKDCLIPFDRYHCVFVDNLSRFDYELEQYNEYE